ncbi:MAG: RagB/SusD family nutrient uptake outer membrane protein, partial [Muribaculaceae bacterium]|nr:RagB/SusD family nutrient uptake outer membrane protein [Muribaculaceae bacterium]
NTNTSVPESVRNNYNGQARMWRARFYFEKLKTYGEVPWIDKVFNSPEDPDLYNGRDTRDVIIGHIIDDLDYAIENISVVVPTDNANYINRWTAALLKSRVCLFEASWRRYHANDELDIARTGCTKYSAEDLYKLAAEAAKMVMDCGYYKIYNGTSYANGRGSYRQLFISDAAVKDEVMLSIQCDLTLGMGDQNWYYNSPSYGSQLSMTRKFMMTYLNIDGTPYSVLDENGTHKDFKAETTGRDLRLNQTIRCADYTCKNAQGEFEPTTFDRSLSLSGFQYTKYVMDDVKYNGGKTNDNDIPVMRYAEVLLNYAEAKAELGTLTDEEWAATIGELRKRAGITGGTPATGTLTAKPTAAEPYIASYYPGVTNPVILEIRRERAIELCLEGFRMTDLKRWACVDLWAADPWEGIYISKYNVPIDLNGDGVNDVCFHTSTNAPTAYKNIGFYVGTGKSNKIQTVAAPGGGYYLKNTVAGREWPVRQYLDPIPEIVRQKNPNLTQNPGW